MVKGGAGPALTQLSRCYRLAVVLTPRAPPYRPVGQASAPPIKALLTKANAPAMSGTDIKTGWTLRPERRWLPGRWELVSRGGQHHDGKVGVI